jgi:hypothetical protein
MEFMGGRPCDEGKVERQLAGLTAWESPNVPALRKD